MRPPQRFGQERSELRLARSGRPPLSRARLSWRRNEHQRLAWAECRRQVTASVLPLAETVGQSRQGPGPDRLASRPGQPPAGRRAAGSCARGVRFHHPLLVAHMAGHMCLRGRNHCTTRENPAGGELRGETAKRFPARPAFPYTAATTSGRAGAAAKGLRHFQIVRNAAYAWHAGVP